MKSDFSRFLHHILSYSGLTRISRWNKFATLFDLDSPIKSESDREGVDTRFVPECDRVWCKMRLKYDFIIKNPLKKLILKRFQLAFFFCNIYESVLCISCNNHPVGVPPPPPRRMEIFPLCISCIERQFLCLVFHFILNIK